MPVDQIEQITGAGELHPAELNEIDGQQRRHGTERKGAADPVSQRFALLRLGKAEHENREHHRVVGAQQSFEGDQERDGEKVGRLNQSPCLER